MNTDNLFVEYFDSVFKHANVFSDKEYDEQALFYEMNYGRFLPRDRHASILDIGCGAGHFLNFLKNKGYKNFLGIDISPQQVDFCKGHVSGDVQSSDAFAFLKDKKNDYSLITANDVLEHIHKDRVIEFLTGVKNALKPDGIFLAKTPNMGNPFSVVMRYSDFTHNLGVTEKSFYQVLFIAGFRDIQILPRIERGIRNKLVAGMIHFFVRKLLWHQGFSAPHILTHLLICAARK